MTTLNRQLHESVAHLRQLGPAPRVAIVLGSGLGVLTERLSIEQSCAYSDIPGFPTTGVGGHQGRLIVGTLAGQGSFQPAEMDRIVVLAGRTHLYEGHGVEYVVHHVRALALWGVTTIVLTNAAGAMMSSHKPGDLMVLSDHINLSGYNPLVGEAALELGPRFVDMSVAYDTELRALAMRVAEQHPLNVHQGVYVSLLGPTYETPSEVEAYRRLGGDAVGMSTVCETIALRQLGVKVLGISCLTNMAAGLNDEALNHQEVKETVERSKEQIVTYLSSVLIEMTKLE